MYHTEHIPIHYVMMIGYDEEKNCVLIYDCDREDIIELAVSDLELAWNIEKNGVGDKNGFIKIRLGENLPDKYTLSCNCLLKKAERQFREKPNIPIGSFKTQNKFRFAGKVEKSIVTL